MTYRLVLTPFARADIIDVLAWSVDQFSDDVRKMSDGVLEIETVDLGCGAAKLAAPPHRGYAP